MERMQHDLIQGTDAWHQFRFEHDGASEAAAMLGLSKKTTRTELLRMKHTGIAKEFSDWVQENVIDPGHSKEAGARPLVEGIIGEPLYPQTYSYGRMSASCDGLTASDEIAFEHKAWNAPYAAMVEAGEVPEEHVPQCQQVMHVTGAEKLIFVMSDGTPEKLVYVWVLPDPAWVKRIKAGWAQFHEDLKTYTPPEYIPAAVAAPIKDLPAISVTVSGALSVETNFPIWSVELNEFIARIPASPSTDQEFADCKAALVALKNAEVQLDAEEARMLSQVSAIDEMKREKKVLFDLSRNTRLALEKLVVARDLVVKREITQEGIDAAKAYIDGLNRRLGSALMPAVPFDAAAAIRNKKNYASMRNSVADAVASFKIAASEIADKIQVNLASLDAVKEHAFLFHDRATLAMKAPDDLALVIKSRIQDHQIAEEKRLAAERERIRIEEEAKATAKAKAEQEEIAAAELRAQREEIARQQKIIDDEAERQRKAAEEAAAKIERDRATEKLRADSMNASQLRTEPAAQPASVAYDSGRYVRLGEINQLLGFTVTSEFLAGLGFDATTERQAKLYRECDFQSICAAIVRHVASVAEAGVMGKLKAAA